MGWGAKKRKFKISRQTWTNTDLLDKQTGKQTNRLTSRQTNSGKPIDKLELIEKLRLTDWQTQTNKITNMDKQIHKPGQT